MPIPKKDKNDPRVPMKPCNITTIDPSKMEKSIWSKIDDSKVKLDLDFLEKEFSKAELPKDDTKKEQKVEVILIS